MSMSEDTYLTKYKELQAAKFAKFMEQQNKEDDDIKQKLEAEAKKVKEEQELKLLSEMQYHTNMEHFLNQLEAVSINVVDATNIVEIDALVVSFLSLLETNMQF